MAWNTEIAYMCHLVVKQARNSKVFNHTNLLDVMRKDAQEVVAPLWLEL